MFSFLCSLRLPFYGVGAVWSDSELVREGSEVYIYMKGILLTL